jgi:hypothetical protein
MMGGEPPANARFGGEALKLAARFARRPDAPFRRAVQDAEQRADGECDAHLYPSVQVRPAPGVDPDHATPGALPAADQQRPSGGVQVGFGEHKRSVYP